MGGGRGGRLFEAGRLLTFSAFSMDAYSRWARIRGWALIRINTVRLTMPCLSRFELYSRWVPLLSANSQNINVRLLDLIVTQIFVKLGLKGLKAATPLLIFGILFHFLKQPILLFKKSKRSLKVFSSYFYKSIKAVRMYNAVNSFMIALALVHFS